VLARQTVYPLGGEVDSSWVSGIEDRFLVSVDKLGRIASVSDVHRVRRDQTLGLDPQTRSHIWDYILELRKKLNITIFLTTHYMEEADHLADRVAIIDRGKIVVTGTPNELKQSIGGEAVTLSPCEAGAEECEAFVTRTQEALAGQAFILGTQATDNELAVYVDKGESAAPAIMRLLSNQGIEVKTLSVSRPSLDDVFLKYTGRTIRAEEGTATTFAQIMRKRGRR